VHLFGSPSEPHQSRRNSGKGETVDGSEGGNRHGEECVRGGRKWWEGTRERKPN
jgi:hypothetical protein